MGLFLNNQYLIYVRKKKDEKRAVLVPLLVKANSSINKGTFNSEKIKKKSISNKPIKKIICIKALLRKKGIRK